MFGAILSDHALCHIGSFENLNVSIIAESGTTTILLSEKRTNSSIPSKGSTTFLTNSDVTKVASQA